MESLVPGLRLFSSAALKTVIASILLSSVTAHAYTQLFDWSIEGWSPTGSGSLPRTYTDVGGQGIDVVVNLAEPTPSPSVGSTPNVNSNGLRSRLNFVNNSDSVTYTFSFYETGTTTPAGVFVKDLTIKDLDQGTYRDAVTFAAVPLGGGSMVPDAIQLAATTNVTLSGGDTAYGSGAVAPTDSAGWATAAFTSQFVQSFTVNLHNGPGANSNPGNQASWISNFTFTDEEGYSAAQCSPGFEDISGTGARLVDAGDWGGDADDGEANVVMPFTFTLYSTSSTNLRLGTNGGIIFGATTGTLAYTNTDIPASTPSPAILPFWDDLNLEGVSPADLGVYYETRGTAPNRRFIVQWHEVHHYDQIGNVTFQVVLFEGSNEINFVYQDVDFGDANYNDGLSATIGLNNDATQASKFSFNTASLSGVDGVCYAPPTVNDFGDAPVSYGDASHLIVSGLYLGASSDAPDAELGSQYSGAADGDNMLASDDENGVTFSSPAGTNHSITAHLTGHNGLAGAANICAWLDIPAAGVVDGVFDSADGQCDTVNPGDPFPTFTWSNLPADQGYTTFARFRLSSDPGAGVGAATGAFFDGEVEDYLVSFDFQGEPTAVTIGEVELDATTVSDFMADLDVDGMDVAALAELLAVWSPASSVSNSEDREAIIDALRASLDPDGDGNLAVLAWDTLEERGTIGFYVDRRQGEGGWERINNDMLPGLITAPMGGEYKLADPGASSGQVYQYRLIEQEARGTTRTYGPFTVEMYP